MTTSNDFTPDTFLPFTSWRHLLGINGKLLSALLNHSRSSQAYWTGVLKYHVDFMAPFWTALNAFVTVEGEKLKSHDFFENARDYTDLLLFNLRIAQNGLTGSFEVMNYYHARQFSQALSSWMFTIFKKNGEDIATFTNRQAMLLEKLVYAYPAAIHEIRPEYGFHFQDKGYKKVAETERFFLYQVLPLEEGVKVREDGKPIILIPPYVLGPNILAFLPGEKKSYVHCFANLGIPTYVRIVKDIDSTPAVQAMTGEDDALDTRFFCEQIKARHGKGVTLNGFCQGGYIAMVDLLSGELDGLVDAIIACVAPMDGTRSKSLVEYIEHLPPRFRDLGYAVKTLPNGNRVVDGQVMSWVYKLKSMEKEAPLFSFYRDLMMLEVLNGQETGISKTAAALNYWLIYDRTDLPLAITKMSFDSYTIPVEKDGTLPVKLFGRRLNFGRLKEKGIQTLICYGERDDLVNKESAIVPAGYVDVEITAFPKGHGGIATSWSHPDSECALHTRFGNNYRGPVRYHLDLEEGRCAI